MSIYFNKWKGNNLQRKIVKAILDFFPSLSKDDVVSCPPSVKGVDIILSDKAKEIFPFKIECKNHERMKYLWDMYEYGANIKGDETTVLVTKRNRKPPLAVVHLNHFVELTVYKAKYLEITNKNNPERNII